MNRRLPRFALLVVLLVSMFGLLALRDAPSSGSILAVADPCLVPSPTPTPTLTPTPVATGTPTAGGGLGTHTQVSQTVFLSAGETVAIQAGYSTLVFVDMGEVKLTVCGDDQVAAEVLNSNEIELVSGGPTTLTQADSVFATSMVTFYFEGVTDQSRLIVVRIDPPGGAVCGGTSC